MTPLAAFALGAEIMLQAILLAVMLGAFVVAALILCAFFIGLVERDCRHDVSFDEKVRRHGRKNR